MEGLAVLGALVVGVELGVELGVALGVPVADTVGEEEELWVRV